jgi:ergothioneine biosynthesis protein EgtB
MPAHTDAIVRHELLACLANARTRTDELFALVKSNFLYERPIAERHRIIFYIGHLEAFDWNLFHEHVLGQKRFHPEFDRLFAFGIDPVGGGLPADEPSDWPSLAAVRDYVRKIRETLDENLETLISDLGADSVVRDGFSLATLLNVAIEHRLMHAETLAYMLHQLPVDRKIPQLEPADIISPPVFPGTVEIPGGTITLGLKRGGEVFGWDNEYESHAVNVPAFAIDRYKVTNRQYLEFIGADGYEARELWSEDDWNWKSEHGVSHPAFWKRRGDQWLYRTMFAEVPLPLDWPVYVSYAEAAAYAKWAGKSLPTEAEWQRAATAMPRENGEEPETAFGNFDFARWNPVPVNAFPAAHNAFGVEGMLGNGWEWTSTKFAPFPGFEPFPFYRGYSADFFDDKHFVLKGGSARTAGCMLRPAFRNWFQPHYQFAYTGFRCVSH